MTVTQYSVFLRNFVPPQLFKRFTALNKLCRDKRAENPRLKTQVRFGKVDLEILTKLKGEEEQFKTVNLKDFIGENQIPDYEHEIKWQNHKDRAPRRRVTSSRSSSPVDNERNSGLPLARNKATQSPSKNLRQLSINSEEGAPRKKIRDQDSMDSCYSRDLDSALPKEAVENKMDETL